MYVLNGVLVPDLPTPRSRGSAGGASGLAAASQAPKEAPPPICQAAPASSPRAQQQEAHKQAAVVAVSAVAHAEGGQEGLGGRRSAWFVGLLAGSVASIVLMAGMVVVVHRRAAMARGAKGEESGGESVDVDAESSGRRA